MSHNQYIAHRRKDELEQSLITHLTEVGDIAKKLSEKIGAPRAGEVIGLLHDLGKFSAAFQKYIGSATGKIKQGEDDYVDFDGLKGKIDHSSAGAQWLWQHSQNRNKSGQLVGQILSLCIASHHSGLIDCLALDGTPQFLKRMDKEEIKTHLSESIQNAPTDYLEKLDTLFDKSLFDEVITQLQKVADTQKSSSNTLIRGFNFGFWSRMLFSCLIDADRINSADFESPENTPFRSNSPVDWRIPISRIEGFIDNFPIKYPIDTLRRKISNTCQQRAKEKQGIYTLTVPTGGGKTYTSLRYALHHAQQHKLDRIIYIIPYTSIIEQNAKALREAIEHDEDEFPWILEQHSNLEPDKQSWHSKLVSENWDAPIIMTTMVQFLEVLFSGGTKNVRKVHQLANSVLIFDEIQTLPIKCTHLFCNALNFLTLNYKTTALLCTATQPLLGQLRVAEKGELEIKPENELVNKVPELFAELKRVNISNKVRPQGWTVEQIAELALEDFNQLGSCLIIVNTKSWAQQLYQTLSHEVDEPDTIFHLSTSLCPAHRATILAEVRERLENKQPVLCISTQLIEAGVDIDFHSVIRFLAGLDSIAQAAGRCNRSGRYGISTLHVVNPINENIDGLPDIKVGRDIAQRVLEENFDDMLAPEAIQQYFKYYFYDRAGEMPYTIPAKQIDRDDNLLNLLAHNEKNIGKNKAPHLLQQSFMSAGKLFKAIDSPTQAVIVPHGKEGKHLITELGRVAKEFDVKTYRSLLKQAQKYSVNVFPNVWRQLQEKDAVHEIQPDEGIYYLDEQHYSSEFGLSVEVCNTMSLQYC